MPTSIAETSSPAGNPFDFSANVAVVTGAGSGIGRATALLLAKHGADLVLAGRNTDRLHETGDMIRSVGRRATVLPTDVKDPSACDALATAAWDAHGRIDFLVNSAGGSRSRNYLDWKLADFDDMIMLNLRSVWLLSRAISPRIRDSGGGAIVNISSLASFQPVPESAPYGMAKAGVNNLTAVMAVDLARWKIRVNCVAPGPIRTEGFLRAMKRLELDPDEIAGQNPLERPGLPDDIAWPIIFFCSPAASFVTGQTLTVSGGPMGWNKRAPDHVS